MQPSLRTGSPRATQDFSFADQRAADGHRRLEDLLDPSRSGPLSAAPHCIVIEAAEPIRPEPPAPPGFWRRLARRLARNQ